MSFSQQAPSVSQKMSEAQHHAATAGEKAIEAASAAASKAAPSSTSSTSSLTGDSTRKQSVSGSVKDIMSKIEGTTCDVKDKAKDSIQSAKPDTSSSSLSSTGSAPSTATVGVTSATAPSSSFTKDSHTATGDVELARPGEPPLAGTASNLPGTSAATRATTAAQGQAKGLQYRLQGFFAKAKSTIMPAKAASSDLTSKVLPSDTWVASSGGSTTPISTSVDQTIRRKPAIVAALAITIPFLLGLLLSAIPLSLMGITPAHQGILSRIIFGKYDLYSYPRGSFQSLAHRKLDAEIKKQHSYFGRSISEMMPSPFDYGSQDEDDSSQQGYVSSLLSHVPVVGSHFSQDDGYGDSSSMTSKAMKAYMAAKTGKQAASGLSSFIPGFGFQHSDEDEDKSSSWMPSPMSRSRKGSRRQQSSSYDEDDEDDSSWTDSMKPQFMSSKKSSIGGGILSSVPIVGNLMSSKDTGKLSRQEEKELQRLIDMAAHKVERSL